MRLFEIRTLDKLAAAFNALKYLARLAPVKPLEPHPYSRRLEMFNALKYIKNLESVGFPREQAEAQVQLVIDSFQENVATKADLAEVKSELKTEIAELKSELKTEIEKLKVAIAELKTDLVFRLGGIIVLCTGILGFLIKS